MPSELARSEELWQEVAAYCIAGGMSDAQLTRFITGHYIPLEGAVPFHLAAREADAGRIDMIGLAGTRGAAKSHTALAQVVLDDCMRFPGLKWLFLRKFMKSAGESMDDLARKVCANTSHQLTGDGITLTNGSRVLIGGYKDPHDIDKYLGIEYDGIVVEEATQLVEDKLTKIHGSMRSSKRGWMPRMYLTTNADGPGLTYFKREFVLPARAHKQTSTRFIEMSWLGNPFVNDSYKTWLASLKGPLAKAWGASGRVDWDAFAGMAFPNWSYERMVLEPEQTFDIPQYWVKWRCYDWGLAAPAACYWLTKNPDTQRLYAYREFYRDGMADQQQAESLKQLTPPDEQVQLTYADPSLWATKSYQGVTFTTADTFRKLGVPLTKADNNRLMGVRKVNNAMADLPDGKPGLMIFYTCGHLIEQLGSLARSETNPEDVDTDQEDHAYDALRYGLTNERRLVPPPPPDGRNENPLKRYSRSL